MSPLRTLLDSAIVNRLGWTLVHFLWEGLAVAVVVGLVLALLRRRGAGGRYFVALAGMLALAALPVVTFLLVPAPKKVAPAAPVASAKSVAKLLPLATAGGAAESGGSSRVVILPPPPTPGSAAANARLAGTSPAAPVEEPAKRWRERMAEWLRAGVERVSPVLPWLVVGWGVGAVLFSVWNLGGWVAVRRLRVRAVTAVAGDVERVVARLAGRMGVWRAVRVLQSAVIDSPIVIGALKPVILVPVGILTGLSPRELESILAHELAHIRRHDYLVNLLQGVIETLLFYHPAVWWVSRRVRVEREHCCDDEAVRATGDRTVYVGALAAVAESARTLGGMRLAPAATGGVLLARVRRVLGLPDADAGRAPRWLAGLVALILCVMATGSVMSHAQDKPAAPKDDFADAPKLQALELTVVDPRTNQPIPDVELSVREQGGPRVFETDDAGKAKIEFKPEPKYLEIKVKKAGFVPTSVTWRNDRGTKDPVPAEYMLKLEPATRLGGIVLDEAGKPIAGVNVSLIVDRKGDSYSTRERAGIYDKPFVTDKDGKWVCEEVPQEIGDPWIKLSHPDYVSDEMYGSTPKPPLSKLRDMTGVMVMKKGVELAGRVVDKDGKPIKGADVAQGRDRFGSSYPSVKTDATGKFWFPQARAGGEVVLTIKAKGMSPELKSFVLPPEGIKDLEVKLEPGHTLKGRVVDDKGNPVPKAMIAVDTWRGNRSLQHRQNTDDQGRFVWNDAPADTVEVDFLKQGFMDVRRKKLVASDQEVTVTLLPPLKVTGTVVDDASGKPVPAFRVIQGIDWGQGQDVYWDTRNQRMEGRDGAFSLEINYPQPGHAVRIDAEGYMPAPSRVFKAEEKTVSLAFRLKKAETIVGTLKTPDGKPLAGAQVVICAGQSGAYIRNGNLEQNSDATVVKSDGAGKFRILPQAGKYALAVLHADGYAEVPGTEFEKSHEITVRPWGRVEGTLKVGSKAKANEMLSVSRQDPVFQQANSPRIYHDIQASTDEKGRFVFERVPAGPATVAMQVKLNPNMTSYSQSTFVEVKPGETVRVDIGGMGRPIAGKVTVPEALKGKVNWAMAQTSLMAKLTFPQPKLPNDWATMSNEAKQKFYEDWRKTPEGQAAEKMQRQMRWYAVRIEGDNTFRVDDVLPGSYQLSVSVQDPNSENRWGGEAIGQGALEFTVPQIPGGQSDEVLDVGTMELKPVVRLKAGDAAPALKAKTLDGKDLSLDELKGKYVLVDFWATTYGPCVEELPKLKEAQAALAKDERVVFLSLSLDQNVETVKAFQEKNPMPWRQGFLGEWSKTSVPGEWGLQTMPARFLIGPDGKIITKGLSADAVKGAVTAALAQK